MSAVYIAVGTAVTGIYSANKASSAAKSSAVAQRESAEILANQADAAAQLSYDLGKEQLDFSKQQYQDFLPFAKEIANQQAAAQTEQLRQGREYYDYQTRTFRPLERGLVQQAQQFNTEAYREQLAGQAAADAARAFGVTQAAGERSMASMGVNPASGRFAGLQNQNQLALAAQRAAAMTGGRQSAEQFGYARMLDVAGLGRNLPGASTAAYGAATGAGTAATGTAMAPGNQYMTGQAQGINTMLQGSNQAINAYGTLYNGATAAAMSDRNNYFGVLGSLVGAGGTIAASKYGGKAS